MTMEPVAVVMAMMATMMATMMAAVMAAMTAMTAPSESNAGSERDQGGSNTKSGFTEHSHSPVIQPSSRYQSRPIRKGFTGTNALEQDRPSCDREHIGSARLAARRLGVIGYRQPRLA